MDIRKIIREQVERLINEADANGGGMFDGALGNIDDIITKDLENVETIIKTQQIDIKNKDNEIKTDMQLKSKLDATSPHKKGLEREIPEKQKDYEVRKKQLKDLEDAKKGLETAKKEIDKQKIDLAKQAAKNNGGKSSALPSLESPI